MAYVKISLIRRTHLKGSSGIEFSAIDAVTGISTCMTTAVSLLLSKHEFFRVSSQLGEGNPTVRLMKENVLNVGGLSKKYPAVSREN